VKPTASGSIAFALLLTAAALPRPVPAEPPSGTADEKTIAALLSEAERSEASGEPEPALDLYERVLQLAPSAPSARTATARIGFLRSHGEGDFKPLGVLLRMQATPFKTLTQPTLEQYERAVDGFPDGPVRLQARAYVAAAWYSAFHNSARAQAEYGKLLAEPRLASGDRLMATMGLSACLLESGHAWQALKVVREAGYARTPEYRDLKAAAIEQIGRPIAWAILAAFAVFGLALVARRVDVPLIRETFSPWNVLLAGYIILPPAWLAWRYNDTLAHVFFQLGLVLAPTLFLAFAIGIALRDGRGPSWLRGLSATAAVSACLAAGFLALVRSEMLQALFRWRGL
jgi:tetratricopeptide (TPR) repeat protein